MVNNSSSQCRINYSSYHCNNYSSLDVVINILN